MVRQFQLIFFYPAWTCPFLKVGQGIWTCEERFVFFLSPRFCISKRLLKLVSFLLRECAFQDKILTSDLDSSLGFVNQQFLWVYMNWITSLKNVFLGGIFPLNFRGAFLQYEFEIEYGERLLSRYSRRTLLRILEGKTCCSRDSLDIILPLLVSRDVPPRAHTHAPLCCTVVICGCVDVNMHARWFYRKILLFPREKPD